MAMSGGGIATTSSWYFRLARAIATGRGEGSLSRLMDELDGAQQHVVRTALTTLPESVRTLEPRIVVPLMASIASLTSANFLTLEALAVAIALDATIVTSTRSALLETAARAVHVQTTSSRPRFA